MSCPNPEYLTVREVADRLRVRRQFVYELWWRGRLTGFRAGNRVRIAAASVQEYIAQQSNVKPPAARTTGAGWPTVRGPVKVYLNR